MFPLLVLSLVCWCILVTSTLLTHKSHLLLLQSCSASTISPHKLTKKQEHEALERIKKKLDNMASIDMPVSEARLNFSLSLLADMKIKYVVQLVNTEAGDGQIKKYPWGEKEHKADGQPGCQAILEEELLPLAINGKAFSLYDVQSCSLPELREGKQKSNGYSDLALGPKESMEYAVTHAKDLVLCYAEALEELKVAKREFKPGQMLLQLVSLTLISRRGQGVVVLGTDCVDKWRLLHFSEHSDIIIQPYTHGKRCIADFKVLIADSSTSMARNAARAKLGPIAECNEEDIDMADFGVDETSRDQAIAWETRLRKLAYALG